MKKLILLLTISHTLVFLSCKKSETVEVLPPPVESGVMNAAFFNNIGADVSLGGNASYEQGYKFSVTKPGRITKLGCKMPNTGSYRVTLWDANNEVVMTQTTINQTANGTLTFNTITPQSLSVSKTYLISIWTSGNRYNFLKTGGGSFVYPFTQGSVSIKGYQSSGVAQNPIQYPTTIDNTYISGIADFEFQPN